MFILPFVLLRLVETGSRCEFELLVLLVPSEDFYFAKDSGL